MTESGDEERPRELLAACITEPDRARRRLPAVIGLLEDDDPVTRLAAAWTCCLVAETHPETVDYVLDRLRDRLREGEVTLELTHALDYLADRHPDAVEKALGADADDGDGNGARTPSTSLPEPGPITRNHYYGRDTGRPGVGRVRYPDASGQDDPRSTYTHGAPDDEERAANRAALADAEDSAGTDADAEPAAADSDGAGTTDDRPDRAGSGEDGSDPADGADPADGTLVGPTADVSAIAAESRFDQLHVLATQTRSRYSEDYRALVGTGSEEQAISLRLLERPPEADRAAFDADARQALGRWADVEAHPNLVDVLDWGVEPRPWLATAFAGRSLAAVGPPDRGRALGDAAALADAVACLHRNDLVHGGIDPETVVYPREGFEAARDEPPRLTDVGLAGCVRQYQNPATVLDPRYAAPEYFDNRFGVVDAATDIYHLGAIIFHLYAGRPPAGGSFAAVRDAVTSASTPVPSDAVADVPPAVDEVVAKAMATRKLTRYETIELLQADLRSILAGETE